MENVRDRLVRNYKSQGNSSEKLLFRVINAINIPYFIILYNCNSVALR